MKLLNLFLLLLLPFSAYSQQQQRCYGNCLMNCRTLAIQCMKLGIKTSETEKLTSCMYALAKLPENKQEGGESCQTCIDDTYKEVSVEDTEKCLKAKWREDEEVEELNCEEIEEPADCKKGDDQNCGWFGGACHDLGKELEWKKYKAAMSGFDEDLCNKLGGKSRRGKCSAKPAKKVKCAVINKPLKKKKKKDGKKQPNDECDECGFLCNWLPNCSWKKKLNKCMGTKAFNVQ